MAWLHAWAGLLVGWVLFSIFITGSATYYRVAITDWMQPERLLATSSGGPTAQHGERGNRIGGADGTVSPVDNRVMQDEQTAAVQTSLAFLTQQAPGAESWEIDLPDNLSLQPQVSWQDAKSTGRSGAYHGPFTPTLPVVKGRDTQGGEFFYGFHFQLYYLPVLIGRWIVGFAAMSMLIALMTGIVTHRRIFVDFFTFRPGKGQRSWLDAHNVSAVLALPYHLMITYTGLVLLMINLMPWGIAVRYDSPMSFFSEAYDFGPVRSASDHAAKAGTPTDTLGKPLVPLAPLLAQAHAAFAGLPAGRIQIDHPGRADATIKISKGTDGRVSMTPQSVAFDGITGARIAHYDRHGAALQTAGTLFGIHEAEFAPAPLRAFFFLSGLSGALMVASGLIMWAKKHRQRHTQHGTDSFGTRLVEQLNVGTIAGLPNAVAAYFWANRLLPIGIAHRSGWEIRIFFIVWAVAMVHPWCHAWRGKWLPVSKRAWVEQLGLSTSLFALLPVVDRLTVGAWIMPSFDLVCGGIAVFLATACWFVQRQRLTYRGHPGRQGRQGRQTVPAASANPRYEGRR